LLGECRGAAISGLGVFLPPDEVTNQDLSERLDTSDQWIAQRTGIRSRRIAAPGLAASDLGIPAARSALEDADVDPADVGLVLCATISPDQLMPATAARVALEAGAVNAGACDLSAGCTGFVYALSLAAGAVAAGAHDHVLVVGAETTSRVLDWEDRSTAVLFGDGAGAALVSASSSGPRILGFDLGNDGSGGPLLSIPAGGSRLPASHETVDARQHFLQMKGKDVYRFATRFVPESARRVLARCGRAVDDVDLMVPHQANLRIIEGAARQIGIPMERVFTNLQNLGNTSCASIPLCLAEARDSGRLSKGDLVLLLGFGAGLTWGSCLLEWREA
jgi:3-oxoacyl-[acyl-carrier-protein] synthase III